MMPVQVDNKFCANCFMHNWDQPEDKSSLKHCPGCRLILYCGKACRKEHWEKVHKNHCQFLADPSQCPESQHDAETCAICRPPAGTGKGKRKMAGREKKRNPASSSYECFLKHVNFTPSIASPHPFPLAGVGDDQLEKLIIIVQKLVHKFKQNPRVVKVCSAQLDKIERFLWCKRMDIWRNRKLLSHDKIMNIANDFREILDLIESVTAKVIQGKAGKDASDLGKIILLIIDMIGGIIGTHLQMDALKNPIDDMPEQFKDLVKLAADNKFEVLDIAEEILDSLSTQVVSYEDIIKKLCGDKKRQNCSFCGVKIDVTEYIGLYDKKCSSVLLNILHIRMFSCGSQDCHTKASSRQDDSFKLSAVVATAYNERKGSRCDFCFQLCPIDEAHRCLICRTVIYCSKSCHKKDKKEHKRWYCIKDERKTKKDRSTRRQLGEISRGRTASAIKDVTAVNIVNETLEAFKFEESKIKKGDNLDTGREHDASIPAAAAVPTAGDDGSKSGTGAANTEHVDDRSTPGADAGDTDHTHGGSAYGAGAENDISEVD